MAAQMSAYMIECASSDIDKLFDLGSKQLEYSKERQTNDTGATSKSNTAFGRHMKVETGLNVNSPGMSISRGGSTLRTGTSGVPAEAYTVRIL